MKKLFVFQIISLFFLTNGSAQTYRELFDRLDQTTFYQNGGYSFYTNFVSELHNNESLTMTAYINMYKATKDIKYLNEFIVHAKRVMDRRDDRIASANPVVISPSVPCSGVNQFSSQLQGKVCWSRIQQPGCILYPHWMETGTITYPMAEFVLLCIENSDINSIPLPAEAQSTGIINFGQFSNWLKTNINQSVNWHITNDWNATIGRFENAWSHNDAFNMQCAIGRTLILMHYISFLEGNPNNNYKNVIETIAYRFYEHLHNDIVSPSPATVGNGLDWYTWCHADNCAGDLWEDISHAWLDEEFAELYYKYFTPVSIVTPPYYPLQRFGVSDMQKFANGQTYMLFQNPSQIKMQVQGGDCNCDQMCEVCDGTGSTQPSDRYFFSQSYCFLSQYNPDIYQSVSDIFTPDHINNSPSTPNFYDLLAYSNLTLYEHLFNPITVKRNTGNQHITGATTGNFNGAGTELAFINNDNTSISKISTFTIDANNTINNTCNYTFSGGNCKNLASGDIIPSITGDEIVTFDNYSNCIKVFNKTGSTINLLLTQFFPLASVTCIGIGEFNANHAGKELVLSDYGGSIYMLGFNNSTFTLDIFPVNIPFGGGGYQKHNGMAVGDFDGDGIDEFVTYSNLSTDSPLKTHSITNGNQLNYLKSCSENNTGNLWNGITSGDFDGDGVDEIMLHRKSDRSFLIYRQTQNDIVLKNSEVFPINLENGIMCSMRLPKYPQSDALVSCRNYDGQISVFNMEGLCPGLNLSNQTIDPSTSLTQNSPIDYHVNNTLIAGSGYTIASPSIVDMSAGKEIIFKPGFIASAGSDLHAYIAPALECNPSTFRKSIPNPKPNNAPAYSYYPKKEKVITTTTITITPNPNAGVFQIAISKNDKPIAVKELKVFDMMGKVIWQTGTTTNTIFDVDISNYSHGIYYVRSINEEGDVAVQKLVKQ